MGVTFSRPDVVPFGTEYADLGMLDVNPKSRLSRLSRSRSAPHPVVSVQTQVASEGPSKGPNMFPVAISKLLRSQKSRKCGRGITHVLGSTFLRFSCILSPGVRGERVMQMYLHIEKIHLHGHLPFQSASGLSRSHSKKLPKLFCLR